MTTTASKPLHEQAYELCLEIEKLTAGEQQTKCSILASDLRNRLSSVRPVDLEDVARRLDHFGWADAAHEVRGMADKHQSSSPSQPT